MMCISRIFMDNKGWVVVAWLGVSRDQSDIGGNASLTHKHRQLAYGIGKILASPLSSLPSLHHHIHRSIHPSIHPLVFLLLAGTGTLAYYIAVIINTYSMWAGFCWDEILGKGRLVLWHPWKRTHIQYIKKGKIMRTWKGVIYKYDWEAKATSHGNGSTAPQLSFFLAQTHFPLIPFDAFATAILPSRENANHAYVAPPTILILMFSFCTPALTMSKLNFTCGVGLCNCTSLCVGGASQS